MKKSYRLESIKHLLRDISAKLLTVNNLINAQINFQINVSYLIYVPSIYAVCIRSPSLITAPCLIDAPYRNYSTRLLGISKKDQNH